MVHLRIVVPSYQSEHALDLLDDTPTVCNLIFLERAARRPEGDVILCDIAREDASVVIADLRELDIDREGSIAIEEIDSEVSQAAEQAERAAGERIGSEPVVWEQVNSKTSESVELSSSFLIFMVISMLIAGVGIYFDQPILIVGAMVVGPDFGPLAGLCVAIVNRTPDLARRSAQALVVGFALGILVTFVATFLLDTADQLPNSINFKQHTLTSFISEPNFFSFYVAAIAGVVGMLSLTSAKSGALVGVLISVATIPAAANVGVAAVYGNWDVAWGAALQLVVNVVAIVGGGLVTLLVQRKLYMRRRRIHLSAESRRIAGLPVGASRRARVDHTSEPGSP